MRDGETTLERAMTEPTTTTTCKFPGCENAPERTAGPGRPPEYCADPAHNRVTAWRERKRLADAERGVTTTEAETEQPVTMARVHGAEMLRQMRDLAGQLSAVAERLTGTVATLGDPTAAEAEVESARAAAEQRAATAEAERADAERRAATADQMRAAADEAAEEMSEHLAAEQARAREAHDRLAEAIEAHAAEAERVRSEAQAARRRRDRRPGRRDRAGRGGQDAPRARGGAGRRAGGDRAGQDRGRGPRPRGGGRPGPGARRRGASTRGPRSRPSSAQPQPRHGPRARGPRQRGHARTPRGSWTGHGPTPSASARPARRGLQPCTPRNWTAVRADAARERDELRTALESRAAVLEESRAELRARAERAERELDRLRQGTGDDHGTTPPARRRRASRDES